MIGGKVVMTTTTSMTTNLTGKKAQFLNMKEDGLKIRATSFKNKKAYNKKDKSWKKEF